MKPSLCQVPSRYGYYLQEADSLVGGLEKEISA